MRGRVTGRSVSAPNTARRLRASPTSAFNAVTSSNGSYTDRVPEGAYAIHAYANGYTDVWRQVVVPAGQGVIPIDIRLTARGTSATMASSDINITHGGESPGVTRAATLTISSGAVATGTAATLTAVGAQGISGLLPLGWSPLAAAEVRVQSPIALATGASTARLTFQISSADLTASAKVLTAVQYDSARDEWHVLQPAVATSGNTAPVTFALPATQFNSGVNAGSSQIALVYPDSGTGLNVPPPPVGGGVLTGVTDKCADGSCPPMHVAKPFNLNPTIVAPTASTVATLTIDATGGATNAFPSGTAIDALVNEQLTLVDGSLVADVPFSADLILYRSLAGDTAVADFKLSPSAKAAIVPLQVGVDHIQILPYPGRLDRGTLIGPSGGHVPSDANVQVDIPTGATAIPLHATAT